MTAQGMALPAAAEAEDACAVRVQDARTSAASLRARLRDEGRAAIPAPLVLRIEDALSRAEKVAERRELHCRAAVETAESFAACEGRVAELVDAASPCTLEEVVAEPAATAEHLEWAVAVAERALVQVDLDAPLTGGKRQAAPPILYPVREPGPRGRVGFIDGSGEVRIAPRFEAYAGPDWRKAASEHPLRSTWARVKQNGRWAYTDGVRRLEPPGQSLGPFSEGRAAVGSGGVWVYIDDDGEAAFSGTFLRAEPFSDGLAVVGTRRGVGFVDERGKMVIPDRYLDARRFSEGKAPVRSKEGWMYVDRAGEPLFQGRAFDDAHPFQEGRARVRADAEAPRGQAKWAFLDEGGHLAIPGPFPDAGDFREGAAAVRGGEGWFHIDERGRALYAARFTGVGPFVDGLAYATTESGEGVIDRQGRFVRKPAPGTATPHPRGVILVEDGAEKRYLDWSGRTLWSAGTAPKGRPRPPERSTPLRR